MADAVTSKIHDLGGVVIGIFTNLSDGGGESAVKKFDASDVNAAALAIRRIRGSTSGMSVRILFDADTDSFAYQVPTDEHIDVAFEPPLRNPVADGATGDILFTTVGHTSGDAYHLQIECVKTPLTA